MVVVGPDGHLVRAALAWTRQCAGVTIARGGEAVDGDLIVCERAALLPEVETAAGACALVPAGEAEAAGDRGWVPLAEPVEGALLLAHDAAAAQRVRPRLSAYARARLAMSRTLEVVAELAEADADGHAVPAYRSAGQSAPELRPRSAPASVPAGTQPVVAPALSPVTIIVPVYNAPTEVRRCLRAIAQHTTSAAELLIVDDASTDPDVDEVLAEASAWTGVRIVRNVVNLGFTGTVNRALRMSDRDIVLLNSDTEVGPRWLEHLVRAATETHGTASVTAVSDNAGAFSVPHFGRANAIPLHLDGAQAARLVAQSAAAPVPAPTGSGFCFYIPRRALDVLGAFDAELFPRGYGEENDFCMRALRAGWTNLVDGRTFVRHVREASFGAEKSELAALGRRRLDARFPKYTGLVREFMTGAPIEDVRARVARAFASATVPRPRLLFAIHEGGGGTWVANLELVRALAAEWEPFVFTSDRRTLRLWGVEDGELVPLREWTLERSIRVMDFSRRDYREVAREVLIDYEIELVHVRHLIKHTFDLPRVAAELGVPVVVSFHDFYFTCPTVNLLDNRDIYCAAECTPGDGTCRVPAAGLEGLPHLKHSFVYQWREEVEAMLRDVDAFVTTSRHARSVHRKALPGLGDRPFELIEHGRALTQRGGLAEAPAPGGPIRILVVANLDVHKGADYMRALRAADPDGRLEFHILGALPDEYADLGTGHGAFAPGELADRVAGIRPAFTGSFSIVPETYSHSITEAWAMGVPVIATDLGAHGERIREHGGGELVPLADPQEAVRRIIAVADDPARYAQLRAAATLRGCSTVADMTDRYAGLYRRVLDGRRPIVVPDGAPGPRRLRRGVLDLRAIVPGAHGVHPGSTYVRVVQRYRHPSLAGALSLSLRTPGEPGGDSAGEGDVVLVQRTALDPARTPAFLAELGDRGAPLVLELDDHLLLKGADDPDYGSHQASLGALLDAAELVLVSTDALAEALQDRVRRIAVVPNLIDERLFLAGVSERPRREVKGSRTVELVYVGSPTHAGDLELLRPAMAELERRAPGRFALNIVGVEPAGPDQEWYRRVVVPDPCKPYPAFVGWLREQRPGWDIALAPLRDDGFNRFKSDLKYLEYAALGLPAVFSDAEPYATVQHGTTGVKVGPDAEAWTEAILVLADDEAGRDSIADAAFRDVTAHRLMRHGAEELLELLLSLAGRPAPGAGAGDDPDRVAVPSL